MINWQSLLIIWWRTIFLSSQQNPPRFIEALMTVFALILLIIWIIKPDWPYLLLCLTYILGSSASIWVSELISPSSPAKIILASLGVFFSILLLIFSLYYILSFS